MAISMKSAAFAHGIFPAETKTRLALGPENYIKQNYGVAIFEQHEKKAGPYAVH